MYLGFIGGIGIPILETIRRWHQLTDLHHFINWFDDYLMGAFLLFAAWKTYQSAEIGKPYLCSAWGAATGMMFMSFFLDSFSDWIRMIRRLYLR